MAVIIKEYLVVSDLSETIKSIQELNVPDFHHEIVKQLVVAVADFYPPNHGGGPVSDKIRSAKAQVVVDLIQVCLKNS